MNLLDDIREACKTAWNLQSEGDIRYSDLFDHADTETVTRLWMVAEEYRKVAGLVASILSDEFVKRGTPTEVDGFFVVPSEYRTDEPCVDHEGFYGWLAEHPNLVPKLFNANYVRKGQLPPAVRDTFFEKVKKKRPEVVPQAIPVEMLDRGSK